MKNDFTNLSSSLLVQSQISAEFYIFDVLLCVINFFSYSNFDTDIFVLFLVCENQTFSIIVSLFPYVSYYFTFFWECHVIEVACSCTFYQL